jgi:hypothetical protein
MSDKPRFGTLRRSTTPGQVATVTPLSNEKNLTYLIKYGRDDSYVSAFLKGASKAKAALVDELREANVDVAPDDEDHLQRTCGVRCRNQDSCVHVLSGDDILSGLTANDHIHVLSDDEQVQRMIVACDPIQTKLRDDAVECFPRDETELVVRAHVFYPNGLPCGRTHDQRGRLVTQKQFVPKDARNAQGYHVFHYASRGRANAPAPPHEAVFPYTSKGDEYQGFSVDKNCTAITVETVFVRNASRQQPPFYTEDTAQARTYVSYLHASELVTDDELWANFPRRPLSEMAMPGFTSDRDKEKFNVLVRLYLLAHDQGWTATLTNRSPHPLGDLRLPVLFRSVSTQVNVADRRDPQSPVLLEQNLLPNVESPIVRFCFRRIVSDALRRRVVARGAEDPSTYVPVVCYLPFGDRTPAFTSEQIAVLAALYPTLRIRKPAHAAEWSALSQSLYQHGVPLLDILQAVGKPLRDAHGDEIVADAYVPYTADMAATYFVVVANRPLRDYTCMINQRWVLEDLLERRCDSATTRAAFAAWVRYWSTMMHLKDELGDRLSTDTVSAHLGQRLPAGARGQRASCLVNGRVTDTNGGLVFAELGGKRFVDRKNVGQLPPGTAVVYLFWWDCELLQYDYVPKPYRFVMGLREGMKADRGARNGAAMTGNKKADCGVAPPRSRQLDCDRRTQHKMKSNDTH